MGEARLNESTGDLLIPCDLTSNARMKLKAEREHLHHPPVDPVFQPLALLFVLFQLLLPGLAFLRCHSLEEPSLPHGFGLKGDQTVRYKKIISTMYLLDKLTS